MNYIYDMNALKTNKYWNTSASTPNLHQQTQTLSNPLKSTQRIPLHPPLILPKQLLPNKKTKTKKNKFQLKGFSKTLFIHQTHDSSPKNFQPVDVNIPNITTISPYSSKKILSQKINNSPRNIAPDMFSISPTFLGQKGNNKSIDLLANFPLKEKIHQNIENEEERNLFRNTFRNSKISNKKDKNSPIHLQEFKFNFDEEKDQKLETISRNTISSFYSNKKSRNELDPIKIQDNCPFTPQSRTCFTPTMEYPLYSKTYDFGERSKYDEFAEWLSIRQPYFSQLFPKKFSIVPIILNRFRNQNLIPGRDDQKTQDPTNFSNAEVLTHQSSKRKIRKRNKYNSNLKYCQSHPNFNKRLISLKQKLNLQITRQINESYENSNPTIINIPTDTFKQFKEKHEGFSIPILKKRNLWTRKRKNIKLDLDSCQSQGQVLDYELPSNFKWKKDLDNLISPLNRKVLLQNDVTATSKFLLKPKNSLEIKKQQKHIVKRTLESVECYFEERNSKEILNH